MIYLLAICISVVAAHINAQSVFHMDKSDIGIMLDGHLILELTDSVTLVQCGRRCRDLTHCLSFNYARNEGKCQLNSATKSQANAAQILRNDSFVFFDVSSLTQLLFDACSSKPCSGTELCVSTRASYSCLNTDCQNAPPSALNGATIQPGSNVIGTIRKYVCPSGKMAIGETQISCPGFYWTPLTPFTCEYVRSCADLRTCNPGYTDWEYWLYPSPYDTTPVKIYCSGMVTYPKEYITVDSTRNVALLVYGPSDSVYPNYRSSINLSKIAVDIQTMIVDSSDRTFTSETFSSGLTNPVHFHLKYGRAYDCSCGSVLGYFKIDTTTTGMILDPMLQWQVSGYSPLIHNFWRSTGGEVMSANCGGCCGYCEAIGDMFLFLNPNYVVPDSEATMPYCP